MEASPTELIIKVLFNIPDLVSIDRNSLDIIKFSLNTDQFIGANSEKPVELDALEYSFKVPQ